MELTGPAIAALAGLPLRFGVPVPRGALHTPPSAAIALPGAGEGRGSGGTLSAQTRIHSRWPDGSARWVLVDTTAPRATGSQRRPREPALHLAGNTADEAKPGPLVCHREQRTVTVSDGQLRYGGHHPLRRRSFAPRCYVVRRQPRYGRRPRLRRRSRSPRQHRSRCRLGCEPQGPLRRRSERRRGRERVLAADRAAHRGGPAGRRRWTVARWRRRSRCGWPTVPDCTALRPPRHGCRRRAVGTPCCG